MDPSPRNRFCQLLGPVHDDAVAFARGLSRSPSDGDDLFQEAALRALSKIDNLREDGAFRVWLFRVIVSVHSNRSRRPFWRRLVPLIGDERSSSVPIDELGGAERLRAALARLPAVQREAIVLFEVEGWRVEEIAEIQNVSPSAVKSRLARARKRLRSIYVKSFGVPAPTPSTSLLAGGN